MAVLSENFYVNNLNNLFNDMLSANDAYYFFIAKSTAWPDDPNPVTSNNSYQEFEHSIYHDIICGKLITNNNIAFLAPNYQWVVNKVYSQYDLNDPNLFTEDFFVVTSNMSVYKCIDNNNGAASLIQPSITPTSGVFQTSDGYTWKYMFTIPTVANSVFTTTSYIPVVPNTYVSNNTVAGTIDVTRVANGGSNYQAFLTGYINNLIDQKTVGVSNGSSINDFYTGSSIYLKTGLGADQIRLITGYNGSTGAVTVAQPFNTTVNLFMANDVVGAVGNSATISQTIANISYIYSKGSFNLGDVAYQSDTGAAGLIGFVNTSTIQFNLISGVLQNTYSIFDTSQSFTAQTGTIIVTSGSNVVTSNTANLLNLSVNTFIQVGANTSSNIRRVASITNSSVATVSFPFSNSFSSNGFSVVPSAFEPISSNTSVANGNIVQFNLSSISINFGNLSSNSTQFIIGETVKEYNSLGVDQGANGIISFVNSSMMVISSISGAFTGGLFVVGQSSSLTAQIINITQYPYITLSNVNPNFVAGNKIFTYYANGIMSGNGTLLSFSYSPSESTQFIISPTVNFIGDGVGVQAYSLVNNSIGNNYPISEIVMLNTGSNYSIANAYVTSNTQLGNGSILYPVISPVNGHGSNAYVELGSRYAGISMTFNNAATENYYFPTYGTYRRYGIIKNPTFYNVYLNLDNVHRQNLLINLNGSNNFVNSEIIYQYSTGAAGKVIVANSTFIQIDNINKSFQSYLANGSANNVIVGLTSNATANVYSANLVQFSLNSNTQNIYSGNVAYGKLFNFVNNNQIVLTNAIGKITSTLINDPSVNSYANIISLSVTNGTVNTTSFGNKFNQLSRITLTSNTSYPFILGEYVNQATSNASGVIVDTTHEVDFSYTPNGGIMAAGLAVTSSTGSGVITFANTTWLRVTGVNGTFSPNTNINTISANGVINATYPVLILGDVYNSPAFIQGSLIVGNTSGAQGLNNQANTIIYPDLVRQSGQVVYVNDITPFNLSLTSTETFSVTIQI